MYVCTHVYTDARMCIHIYIYTHILYIDWYVCYCLIVVYSCVCYVLYVCVCCLIEDLHVDEREARLPVAYIVCVVYV